MYHVPLIAAIKGPFFLRFFIYVKGIAAMKYYYTVKNKRPAAYPPAAVLK